eukprot:4784971-Heterocapsa_arctica.AAC.1
MPKLTGWTKNQDGSTTGQAPEDLNARVENLRFRLDSSSQWKKSGARIWDGMPEPCGCRTFFLLHYHGIDGSQQEGTRCPPDQAVPFWERILDQGLRQDEEEEARAVAEVLQARQEVWQCSQTRDTNTGECVTYFQETQDAKA